jgi:site-specific recombinase XerC
VPLADALAMIERGEIADAKTVIGLLLTERRLRGRMNADRVELPLEAEEFLVWLSSERGRSRNTVLGVPPRPGRVRDVAPSRGSTVLDVSTGDLVDLVAERRASGAATTTIARQLAAIRMLHRYLAVEQLRPDDPTARLDGVNVPSGIPKPLTEEQVTSLLDAVIGNDPLHRRDRALLELLYATGARVSEVVGLSVGDIDFDDALVRLFGKGSKERIVPYGSSAAVALDEWFSPSGSRAHGPVALEAPRRRRGGVPQPARWAVEPAGSLARHQEVRRPGRDHRSPLPTRAAPLVRDAPARSRGRLEDRAGDAGSRFDLDHPGVHPGQPGAALGGLPRRPSARRPEGRR